MDGKERSDKETPNRWSDDLGLLVRTPGGWMKNCRGDLVKPQWRSLGLDKGGVPPVKGGAAVKVSSFCCELSGTIIRLWEAEPAPVLLCLQTTNY